jgi:hypothetical protein
MSRTILETDSAIAIKTGIRDGNNSATNDPFNQNANPTPAATPSGR